MFFDKQTGLIPKVGVEFELFQVDDYKKTVQALSDSGFLNAAVFINAVHPWGCDCLDCRSPKRGEMSVPIRLAVGYDSSLPPSGFEVVSSPIVAAEPFKQSLKEAYDVLSEHHVEGEPGRPNVEHEKAQRGFHIHVHCRRHGDGGQLGPGTVKSMLYDFLPELFVLAETRSGGFRNLLFRNTLKNPEVRLDAHHQAISRVQRGEDRLEWRMWNMPFGHWDYVWGSILVSAALQQAATVRGLKLREPMRMLGKACRSKQKRLDRVQNVDELLEMARPEGLQFLKTIALDGSFLVFAPDDDRRIVETMFTAALERIG